jgi:hypothetical protein
VRNANYLNREPGPRFSDKMDRTHVPLSFHLQPNSYFARTKLGAFDRGEFVVKAKHVRPFFVHLFSSATTPSLYASSNKIRRMTRYFQPICTVPLKTGALPPPLLSGSGCIFAAIACRLRNCIAPRRALILHHSLYGSLKLYITRRFTPLPDVSLEDYSQVLTPHPVRKCTSHSRNSCAGLFPLRQVQVSILFVASIS